jgi:hypothetical protein
MLPTLRPGDRLLVRYAPRVRPGDLVVVRLGAGQPGRPLAVKRAGVRDGAAWWVESDNPAAPGAVDSWKLGAPVPAADVVAVVRWRLPRLAWLASLGLRRAQLAARRRAR